MMKKITTTITISEEDHNWVKNHPLYSFSGIMSWAIRQLRALEKVDEELTLDEMDEL